ncbi:MAG: nitrilase-related carbon-nitrogen hydrolase, partial [Dermatophilaceae bacterium]
MRVAVVQLEYGDSESSGARIERVCSVVAGLTGYDLVVLPELWMPTGFGYQHWAGLAEPLGGPWARAMADAARAASVVLHAGSFVERLPEPGREGRDLANTSIVLGADGTVLAWYRKVHRFGFGAGEPVLMEAGTEVPVLALPIDTSPTDPLPIDALSVDALPTDVLPVGRSAGSARSVKVGLSTCYDLRFPELYRRQVDAGAEVFVVPAAWPAARVAHWSLLGRARAVENQAVVIQCNT